MMMPKVSAKADTFPLLKIEMPDRRDSRKRRTCGNDVNWYATHRPELGMLLFFSSQLTSRSLLEEGGWVTRRQNTTGEDLHINGRPVRRSRVEDFVYQTSSDGRQSHNRCSVRRNTSNGVTHRSKNSDAYGRGDDTDEYVVPDGLTCSWAIVADNSHDSRYLSFMGYVPRENILVKARRITLSWNFLRIGKEIK